MPENGTHYSGEGHLIEGQVEGDVNKTVVPVAVDSQGHLLIDLESSTITIGNVQIVNTSSGNTAQVDNEGDLQVDVNNFPANQNVTVTNAGGAAAVNIQDGGNSITVDGTVTTVPSGTQNVSIIATSVTQPVSGTVTANQGTTPWTISGSVTNTPPANQSVNLTQVGGAAVSEGQKPSATSIPVVIASDQSAIPVSGTITTSPNVNVHDGTGVSISSTGSSLNTNVTNFPATQSVSGIVTANQGTSPWIVGIDQTGDNNDVDVINGAGAAAVNIQDGGNSITVDGTLTTNQITSSLATLTNVSGSAVNVTLLASNASRKMAMIYNDSASNLFVKFGTTASNTSYTVRLVSQAYYELPQPTYTGRIDGIWNAAVGAARITELT